MGEVKKYCLKWNNFSDNILNSLETLWGEEDFVDVTLACEGRSLKAHKVVLSASSLYFRRLLKENPCQHPIVILRDISFEDMSALLNFMYNGQVMVKEEHIPKLLRTAKALEIRGLCDVSKYSQDMNSDPPEMEKENRVATPPPTKKPRPVPMLQSILATGPLLPKDDDALCRQMVRRSENENSRSSSEFYEGIHIKEEVDDYVSMEMEEGSEGGYSCDQDSDGNPQSLDYVMPGDDLSEPLLSATAKLKQVVSQVKNDQVGDSSLLASVLLPQLNAVSPAMGIAVMNDGDQPRKLAFHEPRPCPMCKRIYRDAATLRTHTAIMHTEANEPFTCSCGGLFRTKYDMYSHRKNGHK